MVTKTDKTVSDAEVANVFNNTKAPNIKPPDVQKEKSTHIKICNRCNKSAVTSILSALGTNIPNQTNPLPNSSLATMAGYHFQNSLMFPSMADSGIGSMVGPGLGGYPAREDLDFLPDLLQNQQKKASKSIKEMTNRKRGNGLDYSCKSFGNSSSSQVSSLSNSGNSATGNLSAFSNAQMQNSKIGLNLAAAGHALSNPATPNCNNVALAMGQTHRSASLSGCHSNHSSFHSSAAGTPTTQMDVYEKPEIQLANDIMLRGDFQSLGEYIKAIVSHGSMDDLELLNSRLERECCLWIPRQKYKYLMKKIEEEKKNGGNDETKSPGSLGKVGLAGGPIFRSANSPERPFSGALIFRSAHRPKDQFIFLNLQTYLSCYSDYFSSPLNRFTDHYTRNRQQYASKTLHYFNAPCAVSITNINDICRKFNIPEAVRVLAFSDRASQRPNGSGLIEWEYLEDALDALVACNHEEVPHPSGKYPFLLKLCFASPGRDARVLRPGDLVEVKWCDDVGYLAKQGRQATEDNLRKFGNPPQSGSNYDNYSHNDRSYENQEYYGEPMS